MYNLLVGVTSGEVWEDRLLEYTSKEIKQYLAPADETGKRKIQPERLLNLPTLLMPEIGDNREPQVARIGHIIQLVRGGRGYRFIFIPNDPPQEVPLARIESIAAVLGIEEFELRRTHWAVKDVDLYRVLNKELSKSIGPKVFNLPTSEPVDPSLVAVMMPFSSEYGQVYESLKTGAEAAGMKCLRADDIWEKDHILDDVLSLIWRARVVVADLSGKNPNVLYEAGIAHTLGRDTILIAQNLDDVPFDLRSIRAVKYLNNGEGRGALAQAVTERLRTITGS